MKQKHTSRFAWLCAALCCLLSLPAWGQESAVIYANEVDDFPHYLTAEYEVASVTGKIGNNEIQNASDTGDPAKAFDRREDNEGDNTYFKASSNGTVTFEVTFEETTSFSGLYLSGAGVNTRRAQSIQLEIKDKGSDTYTQVLDVDDLNTDMRYQFFKLDKECEAKEVKVTLTPKTGQGISVNEVWFINDLQMNYYQTALKLYEESYEGITISTKNTGVEGHNDPKVLFDHVTNSWWTAANKEPVIFDITFPEAFSLAGLQFQRGGSKFERAKELYVYLSDTGTDDDWHLVYTRADIDRGETEETEALLIQHDFKRSFTTKYLRLKLVPGDGEEDMLAFNKIWFMQVPKIQGKLNGNKWHDLRTQNNHNHDNTGDTFAEDEKTFDVELFEGEIQAAHTYIDTIYMNPGDDIQLTIPGFFSEGRVNSQAYQRWYSYRTNKTFEIPAAYRQPGDIIDLLTPGTGVKPYRFANGYVGNPMTHEGYTKYDNELSYYRVTFHYPTQDEYTRWFGKNPNSAVKDNDWYVVACDLSIYNDYEHFNAEDWSENDPEEPTLSQRVIYYICSAKNKNSWYHTSLQNPDNFLEEYDIEFPNVRTSNNTYDLVALSKDARSYAVPGEKNGVKATLDIKLTENNANIKLVTTTLNDEGDAKSFETYDTETTISGRRRAIQFAYPDGEEHKNYLGQKTVPANSTATIEVTKKVQTEHGEEKIYNIAKFNLKFTPNTQLLTQSQFEDIKDKEGVDESSMDENEKAAKEMIERRDTSYLREHYEELAYINWDYSHNVASNYGMEGYYFYPMDWSYSSYGFFDGSEEEDRVTQDDIAEWGYYAIQNMYTETSWDGTKTKSKELPNSTYHLYVDASDRPGTIARLPFRGDLCEGAELIFSAWVKNAVYNDLTKFSDAGMLFTVMGVNLNEKGEQESVVPLYRHATGQIRMTTLLGSQKGLEGNSLSGVPHSNGENEWQQVYFSFVLGEKKYDQYILQVDNNSLSTQGGDMYLDQVQVFMGKIAAVVEQKEATCEERTEATMRIDWERLKARMIGYAPNEDEDVAIGFCIIDNAKFDLALQQNNIEKAIQEASVMLGDGTPDGYNKKYGVLHFNTTFDNNPEYKEGESNYFANNPKNTKGEYHFYVTKDAEGIQYLIGDFLGKMTPLDQHTIVILADDRVNQLNDNNYASLFKDFQEPCAMTSTFHVEGKNKILMNGKALGTEDIHAYCIGQMFNIGVQLQIDADRDGVYEDYDNEDIRYDWFFGSQEEYTEPQSIDGISGSDRVSLKEALQRFRIVYPKANEISAENTPAKGDFTQTDLKILQHYYNDEGDSEGIHNRLVLYRKTNVIRILESGLQLVIQPIQIEIEPEEGNEDLLAGLICWEPLYLNLTGEGKSPEVKLGFEDVKYPDTWPGAFRVGLDQIKATKEDNVTINLNLRGVEYATENATGLTRMKLYNADGKETDDYDTGLYLIGSNDPKLESYLGSEAGVYSLGTLVDFNAKKLSNNQTFLDDNLMKIQFNLEKQSYGDKTFTFNPREGYWYQFEVHFEEETSDKVDSGTSGSNCYGNLIVTMHVVPKYQRWIGSPNDNWNNDENWVRSTKEELKASDYTDYTDYVDGKRLGYVPMKFTHVTIPRPEGEATGQVELYEASRNEAAAGGTDHHILDLSNDKLGASTTNIEYDLMVMKDAASNGTYNCETYYTNTADGIHFEPNSAMMHSEYLKYNKAWVDYKLNKGQWYALSTPLKATYSGDFYTDKNGTEGAEYFTNIKWDDDNNRLNPSVYQRGWIGSGATMIIGSGENGERAITGKWSAVYNQADVNYTPGSGFSLKVQDVSGDKALFRLPKEDENYNYTDVDTKADNKTETINRKEDDQSVSGKLEIAKGENITVALTANGDNEYYLVGNPFMAYLNMDKFFEGNSNLNKTYWVLSEGTQYVGNEWMTTGTNNVIAPLQSFFVKKGSANEVTFTTDMQALDATTVETRSTMPALTIIATDKEGHESRAAIIYDNTAAANYVENEDAELFLDPSLENTPMIYTVAGTMATSINQTPELYNIPIGVYSDSKEQVTLSFRGISGFNSATIYDAEKRTETLIDETRTLMIPARTSGRYFLRASAPTGNEQIKAHNAFLIYTIGSGRVMVIAENAPLETIRAYTMNGTLIRHIQASGMQQEFTLPAGIYVITATDRDGLQETAKIRVN